MTKKDIIVEQMKACFEEENWFVTIKRSLEGITAEQAEWKPEGGNSIREILNHLIFWNQRYLHRYKHVPVQKIDSNDYTFTNESTGQNIGDWSDTVNKLYEVYTEWIKLLEEADDTRLEGEAFPGSGSTWYTVLLNITIHNAYHIGQIVTIRRQQGSWSSEAVVS